MAGKTARQYMKDLAEKTNEYNDFVNAYNECA